MWASSFHVWLDFHHVAVEPACVFASLSRCRLQHVDDSKSLTRASSCAESFRCTWVIRSVASASTASSSPDCCCFLGTSLDEAPLLLAGFLIPLNGAPPVCGPPYDARASFTDIFGQSLELGKQAHLFWHLKFVVLARMYFCQGDHLFRCSRCMCLRNKPISPK